MIGFARPYNSERRASSPPPGRGLGRVARPTLPGSGSRVWHWATRGHSPSSPSLGFCPSANPGRGGSPRPPCSRCICAHFDPGALDDHRGRFGVDGGERVETPEKPLTCPTARPRKQRPPGETSLGRRPTLSSCRSLRLAGGPLSFRPGLAWDLRRSTVGQRSARGWPTHRERRGNGHPFIGISHGRLRR